MQNFLLAARAMGLGACPTSWTSYGGEQLMREAIDMPDDWVVAGHVMVGWPRGGHGPVKRHPITDVVDVDRWNHEAVTSLDRDNAQRRAGTK